MKWFLRGKKDPPIYITKRKVIKEYAKQYKIYTLIETGTFKGETTKAVKDTFGLIYTIELNEVYFEEAKKRLEKYPHVQVIHGDSEKILPDILDLMNKMGHPCLFWLDAHTKTITAIREELKAIFSHPIKDNVILIDDVRFFTGENNYPTIPELEKLISENLPNSNFEVKDDIIRICPK